MRPFDTLLCPLVVVVLQDSTDVRRYEPAHAAMRPFDTLLCPLVVVVVQDSTDVSRYEPALSASNLYSASAKSFQQSRLHLENITNPTDEVLVRLSILPIYYYYYIRLTASFPGQPR